jgi:hypothetical protein
MDPFELSDSRVDRRADSEPPDRPAPDRRYPADFRPDEIEIADELRDLFPIDCEELPPLYAQTLMSDAAHAPLDRHYERHLSYRVFRQLGLTRPLPRAARLTPLRHWRPALAAPLRRLGPAGAALVACALLFMAVSVIAASPSFAAGVRILLGHSGVAQVPSYPANTRPSASMANGNGQPGAAAHPLNWVQWLGPTFQNYSFQWANVAPAQEWTDGPVVEMRYARQDAAVGSGVLDVREFRPSPKLAGVLQMVADGSANAVQVNGLPGVYVDGQWVPTATRPTWQSGIRSELIFEDDGLVFWVVADQRDGMGSDQLMAAASQLTPVSLRVLLPDRSALRLVSIGVQSSLLSPIDGELLELVPAGSSLESGAGAFVTYRPGMPLAQ